MFLWRISNHLSLAGDGAAADAGTLAPSRPSRGLLPSESSRRAARDLVHFEMDIEELPFRYRLLKIEVPGDVQIERVPVDH